MPLDQDIYISTKILQPQEFEDNRSIAARRYKQARDMSKPELLSRSVKRAIHYETVKVFKKWVETAVSITKKQ